MKTKFDTLSFTEILIVVVVTVVLLVAILAFNAWLVMLVFGALAASTGWNIAIGFGSAVWVVVLAGLLTGTNTLSARYKRD